MPIAKQLHKKILATSLAVTLVLPSISNAVIIGPIHDPGNMFENLAKQMADLEYRLTSEIENAAKRMLKKELKKAVGLEKSKRGATEMVAQQRLQENLRNNEVAHQNMPVSGLCDNAYYFDESGELQQSARRKNSILTFSMRGEVLRNRLCDTLFEQKKEERKELLPTFAPQTPEDEAADIAKLNEQVDIVIEDMEENNVSIDEIMPHTMIGLTQSEYDLALDKAKIMFAPIENNDQFSPDNPEKFLKATGKTMRSMLPYQTQEDQIAEKLRPTEDIYSERESQVAFAEDFMDAENIENYAYKDMLLPSQVERERAIMTAFLVHMSVLKYKSSLDREMILAAKLVEKIPD